MLAVVAFSVVAPATASAAPPASGAAPARMATAGWTPSSLDRLTASGQVRAAWRRGDTTISVSGAPGVVVTVRPDSTATGLSVGVSYPAISKVSPKLYTRADAVAATTGVGEMSKAQAGGYVDSMMATAASTNGNIIYNVCAEITNSYTHTYGCTISYLDRANGGDWYVAEVMKVSDQASSFAKAFSMWNTHGANNQVIDWSPYYSRPDSGSACHDQTVALNVGPSYASVNFAQTLTVCSGSMSPVGPTDNGTKFGVAWKCTNTALNVIECGGTTYGIVADDYLHSPPSASYSQTVTWVAADWSSHT